MLSMGIQALVVTSDTEISKRIHRALSEMGATRVVQLDQLNDIDEQYLGAGFDWLIYDLAVGVEGIAAQVAVNGDLSKEKHLVILSEDPDSNVDRPILKVQAYLERAENPEDWHRKLSNVIAEGKLEKMDRGAAPLQSEVQASLERRPVGESAPGEKSDPLAWLQDANVASQRLTGLSLSTNAHAALIIRGGALWAYAGHLRYKTALALADQVTAEALPEVGADRIKFVHLPEIKGELILFATGLSEGIALALGFDAATPFSQIRTQALYLVRALTVPPTTFVVDAASAEASPEEMTALPGIDLVESDSLDEIVSPALTDDAFAVAPPTDREAEIHLESETTGSETPAAEIAPTPGAAQPPTETEPAPAGAPEAAELADEPLLAAYVSSLHYACVLAPRLPSHQLKGDLAGELTAYIQHICLVYGWRLEGISIQPQSVQWVVNMPPNVPPSMMVRIIRQYTSREVFSERPRLARENPSGDFWAPGYLIMSSQQLLPEGLVLDFIRQTRVRQGLE